MRHFHVLGGIGGCLTKEQEILDLAGCQSGAGGGRGRLWSETAGAGRVDRLQPPGQGAARRCGSLGGGHRQDSAHLFADIDSRVRKGQPLAQLDQQEILAHTPCFQALYTGAMLHILRPIPVESLKLLAFDLDGTLIDSARDLCNSVNATLTRFGRQPLPDETVAGFICWLRPTHFSSATIASTSWTSPTPTTAFSTRWPLSSNCTTCRTEEGADG